MIDNCFRKFLAPRVGVLLKLYQRLNIHPNLLSLGGLLFAIISSLFVSQGYFIWALCTWWLGRLFDGTDGVWARFSNQESYFGSYLDIVFDMFSYSVIIIGFYFFKPELAFNWLLILFLYVGCITSALTLGSLQESLQQPSDDNRLLKLASGLAEGGETGLMYSVFFLGSSYLDFLSYVWITILSITIIARSLFAWKTINIKKQAKSL